MLKNIIALIGIFFIGMAGGIFASRVLWPSYEIAPGPVFLSETKEIYVQENVALVNAVEKVEKTVISIKSETQAGKILEGSGLVITSDGLMVTLAELVPYGSVFEFSLEGENLSFQILKRDLEKNLALVKLSGSSFITTGFARFDELKKGERVFLIGSSSVNEGIVKSFNQDIIQTNITENYLLAGSPLFNIKGEILGINTVDAKGSVNAIPISQIRDFTGI